MMEGSFVDSRVAGLPSLSTRVLGLFSGFEMPLQVAGLTTVGAWFSDISFKLPIFFLVFEVIQSMQLTEIKNKLPNA